MTNKLGEKSIKNYGSHNDQERIQLIKNNIRRNNEAKKKFHTLSTFRPKIF